MARLEHRYQAFGLRIHAEPVLPELVEAPADRVPADLVVRFGEVGELPGGDGTWARWDVQPGRVLMFYEGVCRLAVRDGGEIVVEPLAEPAESNLYVTGPALAMAVAQRGAHVLHASAVSVDGGALAFAGFSGEGKSTIAAALHERGHRLVADDVVAVRMQDGRALAAPGFPQQKLWPASADALGIDSGSLPRLYPQVDKRLRRLEGEFDPSPRPLVGVFVLERGEEVAVAPLAGVAAAMELVRHSYDLVVTRDFAAEENLRSAARLAAEVPVLRLRRPWGLERLHEGVDAALDAIGVAA